jgi:hypothetical protein
LNGGAQAWVEVWIASAQPGSHADFLGEFRKKPSAAHVDDAFDVLDFRPFTVAGHDSEK